MENSYSLIKSEEQNLFATLDIYADAANNQVIAIFIELAIARLKLGGNQESQDKALYYLDLALKGLKEIRH